MNAAAQTVLPAALPVKLTGAQFKIVRAYVNEQLRQQAEAVERAMVRLYERQTADEKVAEETKHHNGIGFSGNAAEAGSFFARLVKSGRNLNEKNLERARRIALRHSGQLVECIIEQNGIEVAMKIVNRYGAQVTAA